MSDCVAERNGGWHITHASFWCSIQSARVGLDFEIVFNLGKFRFENLLVRGTTDENEPTLG